ncbi:MAG: cytochrome B, partial [bacterium]
RSTLSREHVVQTCGQCHPGASTTLASAGRLHGRAGSGEHPLVRLARLFYAVVIPLTIGGMLLHNAADWLRKAVSDPGGPHDDGLRMTRHERLQHAALLIAFATLAYSGFALKVPEAWWGTPFRLAGGEGLRKAVHRWTALVFVLTGLWHAAYMLGTARGRDLLANRLWPRLRDLTDPVRLLAYNLGLARARPVLPTPCYIERAEYWALIWGSLVMAGTGALLVFNGYSLRHFPLWVTTFATLVHFLEAVLACLSVPAWHFYWTIFDPAVYPMNWAWLTGRVKREPRP